VAKRRSVVFLLSDFLDDNYWSSLKMANRKHDLIGLKMSDPFESSIPDIGLVKVHDPETDEASWIDTGSSVDRAQYEAAMIEQNDKFVKECDRIGFDLIPISTDKDFVEPLMNYFKKREKRI
jgi:uncharacterized protein (DUF58 family)